VLRVNFACQVVCATLLFLLRPTPISLNRLRGAFASVHKVVVNATGEVYAAKIIEKNPKHKAIISKEVCALEYSG
jgi:hypothetical protein